MLLAGDCERGVAIARSLAREAPGNPSSQGGYGVALAACGGSRAEAQKIADSLARLAQPFLRGEHLFQRARILGALGDGDGAVRALQAAFGQGRGWRGVGMHLDPAFNPVRNHPPFVELMKPKG